MLKRVGDAIRKQRVLLEYKPTFAGDRRVNRVGKRFDRQRSDQPLHGVVLESDECLEKILGTDPITALPSLLVVGQRKSVLEILIEAVPHRVEEIIGSDFGGERIACSA